MKIFYGLGLLALAGCTTISHPSLQRLDPSIHQAIFVTPIQKHPSEAFLSAWQKQDEAWHRVYSLHAVIGRNGLAAPGQKKEGDGKTPWGVYPLGPAFGYATSIHTGLIYRQASTDDFWVDDVNSMEYNQWVHGMPQANSFEHLRRQDNLYQYAIVIGYNMHPIVKGAGSAIFMHVWRNYKSPTAGCVAINQRSLRKILHWLDQQYQPVIILE